MEDPKTRESSRVELEKQHAKTYEKKDNYRIDKLENFVLLRSKSHKRTHEIKSW